MMIFFPNIRVRMMFIIRKGSILSLVLLFSCKSEKQINISPNVLWLVAEDLSPYLPPFGDSTIATPNLNRLANDGVRYNNVFSVSGVCAPSRSAIVTGMYPTSIGAHHMRTLFQQPAAKEKGLIDYEVVPPPYVKMVSQILREEGYYCTNNKKEDYQFRKSVLAWDESSIFAHWRNRPEGSKFFSVFNFGVTHESNIWDPWYRQFDLVPFPPERNIGKWWEKFAAIEKPLYVPDDIDIKIPPYLPDSDIVRMDMQRMYSNIVELDEKIGLIIDQLEEDGLLEETIIVFYSDHGGPLPRQKRLLYDSGIKVPLIIRYPNKIRAGEIDERLISFVDFAPTLLSMIGVEPPDYHQGFPFEGKYKSAIKRNYIFAAADRFDEHYDQIRAVRDKQYKYLRNYYVDKPYYLPLEYRENMNTMKELLHLEENGKLDSVQLQWFRKSKPQEELFDTFSDPHEIHNLADNPDFHGKLIELRGQCNMWIQATDDKGFIPEAEQIKTFWPNNIQPKTVDPVIKIVDGLLYATCETESASIGYKYQKSDFEPHLGWIPYTKPVKVEKNKKIDWIAHRIGFSPSQIKSYKHER